MIDETAVPSAPTLEAVVAAGARIVAADRGAKTSAVRGAAEAELQAMLVALLHATITPMLMGFKAMADAMGPTLTASAMLTSMEKGLTDAITKATRGGDA